MPRSLITQMKEMKNILAEKNYKKNIPTNIFKREFMIYSGYGEKKVDEWFENFKDCKLIFEINNKINFNEDYIKEEEEEEEVF